MNNALLVCVLAACLAAGARAASPTPTLVIESDRFVTTLDKNADKSRTTYTGNVFITRGNLEMRGHQAVVYTSRRDLDKIVVTGTPVRFTWNPENARTVHGHALVVRYFAADNVVVLERRARLTRADRIFTAAHIRYDLDTRIVKAHGSRDERVHVVIPPASGTAAGSPPPR